MRTRVRPHSSLGPPALGGLGGDGPLVLAGGREVRGSAPSDRVPWLRARSPSTRCAPWSMWPRPENDRELCAQAKELSVRELAEVARTAAARARSASVSPSRSEHDSRYLRFNDEHRTMTVQLPERGLRPDQGLCRCLCGRGVASDEEKTPLDQRRCDGFMAMMDSVTGHGAARAPRSGTTSGTASAHVGDHHSTDPQPVLRGGPCALGGPGRRGRGQERAGGRARAPWPDRPRDGPAHRL